jgi:GDP/UDP-N,N'-diacetylbacillosamine 2-epimerase (hydrolysing)
MSLIKVCVITSSRSEYGLIRWLMDDLKSSDDFELKVIATGSHFSEKYGLTYQEIESNGFTIDKKIPFNLEKSDQTSVAKATGLLTGDLVDALDVLNPDIVMVMGDRYELLSVLTACILKTIPIAHISGGEITEGAIDDQIRHAMTKASHLHYVANEVYGARIVQMGEEQWRVCVSGEPGLDNLYRQPLMSFDELQNDLGMNLLKPTALVTFHPVTLELEDLDWQVKELLMALNQATEEQELQYLITFPNADPSSINIIKTLEEFTYKRSDRKLVKSLGQTRYLSALKYLSMMIGNSSSGLTEAPSFSLPVINIGNRQQGRMKGQNVFDVGYTHTEINEGIKHALSWDRTVSCYNPYGNGNSSLKILEHLRHVFSNYNPKQLISKKFINIKEVTEVERRIQNKYDKL